MKLKEYIKDFKRKHCQKLFSVLVKSLFKFESFFYKCKCVNYPKEKCVFALWHAHQCALFSCNIGRKTCIMVSNSKDGEIISQAANFLGVETVRGSLNKGGAKASLELIKKIKTEDCNGAITIDGPRGPKHVVKKGIIEIAKLSGVPVVPFTYWSPQKRYLKFNSWDEFRFPLIGTDLVLLCGEPIEIPSDINKEETEQIRIKIETSLKNLYEDVQKNYHKYLKQ